MTGFSAKKFTGRMRNSCHKVGIRGKGWLVELCPRSVSREMICASNGRDAQVQFQGACGLAPDRDGNGSGGGTRRSAYDGGRGPSCRLSPAWRKAAGVCAGELPMLPKRTRFRDPADFTYSATVRVLNRCFDPRPDPSRDPALSSQLDDLVI